MDDSVPSGSNSSDASKKQVDAANETADSENADLISPEMLKQEKALERAASAQLAKDRKKAMVEEDDRKMKEIGYRRLMQLLDKSKHYAQFLKNRISHDRQNKFPKHGLIERNECLWRFGRQFSENYSSP